MATIKAILKKKNQTDYQTNKLGEALVYIQYGHQGKKTLFSTGVHLEPRYWNGDKDQNKLIKPGLKGYSTKTSLISKHKFQIDEVVTRLSHDEIEPTVERVKEEVEGSSETKQFKKKSVADLFQDFIHQAEQEKKSPNTIKGYNTFFNHLTDFLSTKKQIMTIDKIDLNFIDEVRRYLITEKNLLNNSSEGLIKSFKAFLSKVKNNGHDLKIDPSKIKIKWERPQIIFLTVSELDQLYAHKFERNNLSIVRDLFVLGCCTGYRYSDLSRLSKHHIVGNIIQMKAYKNMKDTKVPIIPRAREILEKYNYEIPRYAEPVYNRYIKNACKEAEINSKIEIIEKRGGEKEVITMEKWEVISSHNAVSTFITHCLQKGMSAHEIARMTGKTTKVIDKHYAGVDEDNMVEKMLSAYSK